MMKLYASKTLSFIPSLIMRRGSRQDVAMASTDRMSEKRSACAERG